jgi:hypothetical protein
VCWSINSTSQRNATCFHHDITEKLLISTFGVKQYTLFHSLISLLAKITAIKGSIDTKKWNYWDQTRK